MDTKQDNQYKSFYKNLKIKSDTQNWDFDTVEQLRTLMTNAGFRTVKDKETGVYFNKKVTDNQVVKAWNYLKKTSVQKEITDRYYDYTSRGNYRANRDITINGKTYKKGQFVPKKW